MLVSGTASTLAGCTGDGAARPEAPTADAGAPVIVPGAPGDAGRTAGPGERPGRTKAAPSAADVRFTERMVPHHRQALEMAGLAPSRAADPGVRGLAERISVAQRPEIEVMTRWLRALGRAPADGHDGRGAGGEGYGMASLAEMNALRSARGTAFDALFLRLMIRHHEGAVKMAGEELAGGTDQILRKLAQDMASGQRVEILRMRRLAGKA
ncbi:DUF305 domain-containing protein [Sphaerisporangium melleum]|uniref:Lipoprotein n=1 Tax=Sphaerisporangium melleum TaxID=321316 RepID=A0A917R408_9ACTN|nr:DUF305 domain-containing protein [Sphaerisporangium melleum]GGK87856.1 lipoprotein [Sphaerisporangium melleum]